MPRAASRSSSGALPAAAAGPSESDREKRERENDQPGPKPDDHASSSPDISSSYSSASRSDSSSALSVSSTSMSQPSWYGSSLTMRRMIVELGVDGDDLAGDRRDQLVHRLHGFELAERLALLDLVTDVGKLDGDDLTELALRVLGDAEMRARSVDAKPEMIVR